MKQYDVVVIGAGNGGLAAAVKLLSAGRAALYAKSIIFPAVLLQVLFVDDLNLKLPS